MAGFKMRVLNNSKSLNKAGMDGHREAVKIWQAWVRYKGLELATEVANIIFANITHMKET